MTISRGEIQRSQNDFGSLVRACEGCYDFATAFRTPFISGKDSLYNESPLGPVTPTLLITAVGVIPNLQSTTSMDLKAPGNLLYIIGETFNELGGSEYYKLKGYLGANVPKVKGAKAKRTFKAVTKAIDSGLIKSCHDLSEGGLAVAAAEMAFAGGYGLEMDLLKLPAQSAWAEMILLCFLSQTAVSLWKSAEKDREEFETLMKGKMCVANWKSNQRMRNCSSTG